MSKKLTNKTPKSISSCETQLPLSYLRQLFDLIKEKEIAVVEWQMGETQLKIQRQGYEGKQALTAAGPLLAQSPALAPSHAPVIVPSHATQTEGPKGKSKDSFLSITSPFVGTFYRASAPDRPAYVELGQKVEKGTPLCIIEAMKLMNEIESDHHGKIVEICVENGQPVEFGQCLFLIEP